MSATAASKARTTAKPVRWRRIGVMDVGSNSVRLVVYDVRGRAMQPRFNEKVLAGLGRGLGDTGSLNAEGVEIAIAALARFASITRAQKVENLFAFATAAVREASDGKAFVDRVKKETGISPHILRVWTKRGLPPRVCWPVRRAWMVLQAIRRVQPRTGPAGRRPLSERVNPTSACRWRLTLAALQRREGVCPGCARPDTAGARS
ncbi:MAG: hypothetical protein R3C46_00900 [Hyphomonadaceae bacterium]